MTDKFTKKNPVRRLYVFDLDKTLVNNKDKNLKILYNKLIKLNHFVIIVTGRTNSSEARHDLSMAKLSTPKKLFAVGPEDTHKRKKALVKTLILDNHFTEIYFFDDKKENIEWMEELQNELGVKVKSYRA